MSLISLIIFAYAAYGIVTAISLVAIGTTEEDISHKVKLIPAELVWTTLPLNFGLSMNDLSAFRLIASQSRTNCLIILVMLTIFVYVVLFALGKRLHGRNLANPFCSSGEDFRRLKINYIVALFFILITVFIATL